MKDLDDLLERIEGLYIPIYVKGKEYPGNNPYILNKINNMLAAGKIKEKYGGLSTPIEPLFPSDISWSDSQLYYLDDERDCILFDGLFELHSECCDEISAMRNEENERLSELEGQAAPQGAGKNNGEGT